MTTKPELNIGSHLLPGLAAVGLFVVMAVAFLTASFPQPQGFGDVNITASIGYAMFNLGFGQVPGESFLVAFILMGITLDVALDGALHLAKHEGDEGQAETVLLADGGRKIKRALFDDGEGDD